MEWRGGHRAWPAAPTLPSSMRQPQRVSVRPGFWLSGSFLCSHNHFLGVLTVFLLPSAGSSLAEDSQSEETVISGLGDII